MIQWHKVRLEHRAGRNVWHSEEGLTGPHSSAVDPTATREFYVCDEQLYLYDGRKTKVKVSTLD